MEAGTQKYRAFVAAVDTGSLAAAAEALGYAVSSISRMVADLEAECGFALVERRRTGVVPTAEGQRMLAEARSVLASCDHFAATAAQVMGLEVGTVRIGTFSSAATAWLPGVLKEFTDAHPGIGFELLLGDYTEIKSWLAEGRVDLGFLKSSVPSPFETQVVARDSLVAVVPEGHRRAKAKRFPLAAFADEPFIAIERGRDAEGTDLFAEHGIDVKPAYSIWDDYAIMAMVEAGLGLAMLPSLEMSRCAYRLATVPLDVPARRDITIAWNPAHTASAASKALLQLAIDSFAAKEGSCA